RERSKPKERKVDSTARERERERRAAASGSNSGVVRSAVYSSDGGEVQRWF
ncbi:hypothetical protein A2U01_0119013, partial [Trifolium medium]|nr:hypothetical protein [Trifolium medium]